MGMLFGRPKAPPIQPPPPPRPVAPLPDETSPTVREARRDARASLIDRGGRESTILTPTLGGRRDRLG
jgi:hypothetical protein